MIRVKEKTPTGRAVQLNTRSADSIREVIDLLEIGDRVSVENLLNRTEAFIYIPQLQQNALVYNGDYIVKEDDTNLVWAVQASKFPELYEII